MYDLIVDHTNIGSYLFAPALGETIDVKILIQFMISRNNKCLLIIVATLIPERMLGIHFISEITDIPCQ